MHGILPVLVACALVLALVGGGAPRISAAAPVTPDVAGLVVSYGDGAFSYATVPLDGQQLDGLALLKAAGLTVLAIDFGGYGQGVCKIEVVGCDVSACRTRLCQTASADSPFWRFLVGGATGWVLSPLGASAVRVKPGQVYGWAWAGGTGAPDGLAMPSLDEVMTRSGFDRDATSPRPALANQGRIPGATDERPAWDRYLAAGGILVAMGAGGLVLVRRASRRREGTPT
ncbi:MAG: hypothetical protein ACTHQE_15230 [Thermomicrobiales bacterium]